MVKVYKKRGKPDYKAKKLIQQLEPVIEKMMAENPEFARSFQPAETYEELVGLHDKYAITDAHIISETKYEDSPAENNGSNNEQEVKTDGMAKNTDEVTGKSSGLDMNASDPMNEANPIVRDYVLNDSMAPDAEQRPSGGGSNFEEPINYEEAFRLPDMDLLNGDKKKTQPKQPENNNSSQNNNNNNNSQQQQGGQGNNQAPKGPGFNPAFDELAHTKKVKQTKAFAKNVVAAVSAALELGYVWWITKDINEGKLAEYSMNDSIDLELLISLDENQDTTIREFFQSMCAQAEQTKSIPKEDQDELADALAEVLLEKGIAPTPLQNLMIIGFKILAQKAVPAMVMGSAVNKILEKGFQMKKAEKKQSGYSRTNNNVQTGDEQTSDSAEGIVERLTKIKDTIMNGGYQDHIQEPEEEAQVPTYSELDRQEIEQDYENPALKGNEGLIVRE